MSEDYDVDEDVIRNDAENLIQKLRALDLIID
jgi:hypothetical protein